MRRLITGYAVSFNRRHQRIGHLFQNRYKSIVCQEEIYFKELLRYIHLNPLRADIVSDISQLAEYPYCGHSAIIGKTKREWQDTGYVLGYFGIKVRSAQKAYLEYMEAGSGQGRREELTGGGLIRSLGGWQEAKKQKGAHQMSDERILGESDFVSAVLAQAEEQYERQYELKQRGYDLDWVAERVSQIFGVVKEDLVSKGNKRRIVPARSLLCYWAVQELGFSRVALAKYLGMSPPGVGYAVERGEKIAREKGCALIESRI